MKPRTRNTKLGFVLPLLALLLTAAPMAAAQPAAMPVPGVKITSERGGVRLRWQGEVAARADKAPAAQLVALEVRGDAPLQPRIEQQAGRAWNGLPKDDRGARSGMPDLPAAPLEVLRSSRVRGRRIDVLRLSPVWATGGSARLATSLDAFVPGATPLDPDAAAYWSSSRPFGDAAGPGDPRSPAVRITVDAGGMQRLTGDALAGAGFVLGGVDPRRLHLRSAGQQVALELRGTADGRFDAGDELRFWAAAPGDRWNSTTAYWLTAESTDGLRMAQRSVATGAATLRDTAYEHGRWRLPKVYDSREAGPSDDHWFSAVLRAGGETAESALDVPLAAGLPLAAGSTTLTVSGTAGAGAHTLAVSSGAAQRSDSWSGRGRFARSFDLPHSSAVRLSVAGQTGDNLALDAVSWTRPVTLDAGGRGARFEGVAGTWRYRIAGVPAGAVLYDVSAPLAPELLLAAPAAAAEWQDGPAARSYVLAGPGTLHTPHASPYRPVDLAAPLDADAVYIAPAALHAALAPLLARRQAQGYRALVVDTQAIYDGWSWGQVDPRAIRAFLRYAAATWRSAPQAVTLVGDGTSDPLNYGGTNQLNWVPPYLATVDPWLGETACETCYAQLDGDDPLGDAMPDLLLGRLPVKSAAELERLTAKIIGYETSADAGLWRSRAVFVADDADSAGNFAALADAAAVQLPPGVRKERVYFAPGSSGADGREASPLRAWQRTVAAIGAGPGLATYVGHSSFWQWATTDPTAQPPYLLGLYDPDSLPNRNQLSIVLEMTCLTAAFHTPAVSGTTIDERLLLSAGGAVAVWGPTGLGVAHGHDALQRGFHSALWRSPAMEARLGALANAGYLDLYAASPCCQDALRTFALLGDPLTPARVRTAPVRFLPSIRRN